MRSTTTVQNTVAFIDLQSQYQALRASIQDRIQTVLDHGHYIMGPEVQELETRLAAFVHVTDCISVASGTDALLIAMLALGIGPGDEVITPSFSFVAVAEMVALLGAKPVFIEIDPATYHLRPDCLEALITPKTKLIVPVSLYGQCVDFDAITAIASQYNIPVIEDGAQSLGATYRGKPSCSVTTISCTSFYPSKPLGCYGDGGACFTNDPELAHTMRVIRDHGQQGRYAHHKVGITGRLDTLQAAILLAKLEVFPDEIKRRQQVANQYNSLLDGLVQTPYLHPHNTSVYAQYTVQVENREALRAALSQQDIPTAVHYPIPLHNQPAYAHFIIDAQDLSITEKICARVLSLPMHPYLSAELIERIVEEIARFL